METNNEWMMHGLHWIHSNMNCNITVEHVINGFQSPFVRRHQASIHEMMQNKLVSWAPSTTNITHKEQCLADRSFEKNSCSNIFTCCLLLTEKHSDNLDGWR